MSCISEETARAEDSLPVSIKEQAERKEARLSAAKADLADQYMAAAGVPLIATVPTPTDRLPARRAPFLGVFEDDLSAPGRMARVLAILLRSAEGRELVEEMADYHGEYFAEFYQS